MRAAVLALIMTTTATAALAQDDPYAWLEDVGGAKPLAWVKARDAESQPLLESRAQFKEIHPRLLSVYTSRERIPTVAKLGRWLYNFWQDEANPRGVWRRTTLDEYRKKEPRWEVVLDIDKLSAAEGEKWVWKGDDCLYPEYKRCLVHLSRGGQDADEIREFDLEAKAFVKGGFVLPESKGGATWRDIDTLYIARDFGAGSMTTSGYPRVVKEWKRGTPMAQAKLVFEGDTADVGVQVAVVHEKGRRYEQLARNITFWDSEKFVLHGGKWYLVDVPLDANIETLHGQLFVQIKKDWSVGGRAFKAGSLLAASLDRYLEGARDLEVVFEPGEGVALESFAATRGSLVLDVLDNVKSRIVEARLVAGRWQSREVPVPPAASIGVSAVDPNDSDEYWLTVTSFVEPTTLYLARGGSDAREKLKALPAFFDARGVEVRQYEAKSKDGTRVPYFVVMHENTKLDGTNPAILYGYGGFEISMTPSYNATLGIGWLEKGGVYILANIRGGGEFGPAWHLAALREKRQNAFDDFYAVAEDVIKRGITSPRHLGIMGGSNGGLLVGVAFTQRPELFHAVVCQVPLLDMRRYNKLLAGASWMGEYGNPDDPKDWEFISKYSPYQNVFKDRKYPRVLFVTSTRDDRVHPGHARKMVAKMKDQGHDVLYYENVEGGHAAASTPAQQAYMWALTYTFLLEELR